MTTINREGVSAINAKPKFVRVNHNIIAPTVRVVRDGQPVGIMSIKEARDLAYKEECDLIEIVPNAKPPVVTLGDFQKFKYEQKKHAKEQQSKNKGIQSKEIRLRYCTDDHDLETKVRSLRQFLEEKRQVKLVMRFKNRELAFKNMGFNVINKMVEAVQDIGVIQFGPKLDGKSLIAQIVPKAVKNA